MCEGSEFVPLVTQLLLGTSWSQAVLWVLRLQPGHDAASASLVREAEDDVKRETPDLVSAVKTVA